MLDTIERQVAAWSELVVAGVPADAIVAQPDYDVVRRAFRLKRFGRCPACDEKALTTTSQDGVHVGRSIWCSACQWALFVWDCVARDPDELLLEIVRGVPVVA